MLKRTPSARRTVVLLTATLSLATSTVPNSSAQAAAPTADSQLPSTPRIVSRTNLVLIPTVVTDKSGAHIDGLTKDEFYVRENGTAQKISVFEEVTTHPGVIRRVDPNDTGFTNAVTPETRSQRVTMIVLDTLNTRFEDQVRARREILKFVEETLQPDEPVSLMTIGSGGLNVLNDFTTDPKVLAEAVRKVRGHLSTAEKSEGERADLEEVLQNQRQSGRAPVSQGQISDELYGFEGGIFDRFEQQEQATGVELTLRALRQIAESFAGVPGRKSLIWATGGLPFIADDPDSFNFRNANLVPLYESAWNALNESQISVYPLDMGGLFNSGFVSPRFRRPTRSRRAIDSVSNLETLAKMTGGKLCEFKMNLSGCYNDTQKDANHYYLIGYYTDLSKGKTGWRKLEVVVPRPHVEVRARSGYYVRSKEPDPKRAEHEDMDTAITSPTDFTAVPMLVRWTGRAQDGAKVRLNFQFNVAGPGVTNDEDKNNLISLAFGAFAKTANGGIAGDFVKDLEGQLPAAMVEKVVAHGVVYDGAISVPPGKFTVRFIVRDNLSGRLGTVSVPVDAEPSASK